MKMVKMILLNTVYDFMRLTKSIRQCDTYFVDMESTLKNMSKMGTIHYSAIHVY